MKNLQSKSVLITGGGSGIGKAIAERFLEEGAQVMIADMNEISAKVAQDLGAAFVLTNVVDPASFEAAIQASVRAHSRLDILINNAGIGSAYLALHDFSISDWQKIMDINLNGVFYGMKYGLGQMVQQGEGGVVINLSSIAGLSGISNVAPYSASKGAVAHLTRCAAVEYGPKNIRVNAVAPTVVFTPLIEGQLANDPNGAAVRSSYESMNPLPGAPTPADIAAAVAFLSSDDARYISGITLPVDGGYAAK